LFIRTVLLPHDADERIWGRHMIEATRFACARK